jgi:predicted extracellular nuclease
MPKSYSSVLRRVSAYRNHLTVLLIFAFMSLGFLAAPRSLTSVLTSADAAATELFISEYIEGSSNNKAIEIYNGTGTPINLGTGGYYVQMFFNGSMSAGLTINLTGTIAPGDVFVLAHSSADPAILAQADQTNGAGWFNGDDAIVLRKGVTILDSVGQFGFDPGSEWGSGLTSTADNTLRRKSTVCAGDPISHDAFNPATEWDGFATNTFSGLGAHSCGGPTPTPTPPPAFKAIHEIQGPGAVSPLAGQFIFTTGVVTAKKSNGFFVQTEDTNVDADPNTSQGIFAFTGSAPTVAVGDNVQVTGTVAEFFNLTEINVATDGILVQSSGNALPAPVSLSAALPSPNGPLDQLEPLEGMRVSASSFTSVAPTNEFGEIHTVVTGVARPFREPGIEAGLPIPPDPTSGVPDPNIAIWDRNPERVIIDTDALAGSAVLNVTSNVELTGVTGPLDFTFDEYKIAPETAPAASPNMTAVPVPDPAGSHFTVAGYNIENYNGAATQRTKAALAIRDVLRLPDIIGHVEIGSLAALQSLADEVNAITLDATGIDPQYKAYLIPFGNNDQHVGYLVKE